LCAEHSDPDAYAQMQAEERSAAESAERQAKELRAKRERAGRIYELTLQAIVAKSAQWPVSESDFRAVLVFILALTDNPVHVELMNHFKLPYGNVTAQRDLAAVVWRASKGKLLQMAIGAMLFHERQQQGYSDDCDAIALNGKVLQDLVRRYRVSVKQIETEVDAEIDARLGLRAQNPPPVQGDERKAAIAKLDTLAGVAPESGKWKCGMCGHASPARFKAKCQRCGALKGMGSQPDAEAAPEAKRAPKANPAKAKASAKKAGKGARKGGKK
jgi:hypothetical protein